MGKRTRKLRLLQGARRIARAQWAAPAGARGLLPAGLASPKLRLQRLRSASHMLSGSDRGLSASRARAPAPRSTFWTVRLRSTPWRAHLQQARARVRVGWGGAVLRVRDGLPLRVLGRTPAAERTAPPGPCPAEGVSLGFCFVD